MSGFRSAVVTFPGSNCDRDMAQALEKVSGNAPHRVWHGDAELPERLDFIALPGGFSYGDYLRCGAIASRSPIMRAVIEAATRGTPVLGVCNGFQVLTESGLLPGALMRNAGIRFVCREVELTVENSQSLFTGGYSQGQTIRIPIAHHDGNYFADEETLNRLEGDGRVAFRYGEEVNGSARRIAGVLNEAGNVLGMMPHPERAIEQAHGGSDGRALFESAIRGLVSA
jgi:phosphoribosylformylglycinamidine synthase